MTPMTETPKLQHNEVVIYRPLSPVYCPGTRRDGSPCRALLWMSRTPLREVAEEDAEHAPKCDRCKRIVFLA